MITIKVKQFPDEFGDTEEFTSDVSVLVGDDAAVHLDSDGLPKVGTALRIGMIAVGKLGRKRGFSREKMPRSVDLRFFSPEEIQRRYRELVYNASRYILANEQGTVVEAFFDGVEPSRIAIVRIVQPAVSGIP